MSKSNGKTDCPSGKIGYFSERAAVAAGKKMSKLFRVGSKKRMRAYKCPECHEWHLSSKATFEYSGDGNAKKHVGKNHRGKRRIQERASLREAAGEFNEKHWRV